MTPNDERFYAELPAFSDFVEVSDPDHYRPVPDSWLVVITDVVGSTEAVARGRYKDVNALGVASIVALRNALSDLTIPFVFGGDGATLLVPATRREVVEQALRGVMRTAREAFDLEIRTGIVPVAELRREGHELFVSRYQASPEIDLAMLSGEGLTTAETWIKDSDKAQRYLVQPDGPARADLQGFECRWRPIPSVAARW
jgi:hypothetical protein